MSDRKKTHEGPSFTPWDDIALQDMSPSERIVFSSQKSIYGFRHQSDPRDIDFFNAYERKCCPFCSGRAIKNGRRRDGLRLFRCSVCGRQFNPTTNTVFEGAKLPVAAWADFILQALSFESTSAMTREDRRAATTTPYWMGKLFLVLEGIQDDVVLGNEVWIDETFWSVAAKDTRHLENGLKPRGLSKNKICICAACDRGHVVVVEAGKGKPSRQRIWDALGTHIARGSKLYHDMERAHKVLVDRLGLKDFSYNASGLKGLPDDLNPLAPVNRVCYFVKSMLRAHSGYNRDDTQGYLDLLSVALNPPRDKMEKVAMVLDRAMNTPKSLHYRQFYGQSTR